MKKISIKLLSVITVLLMLYYPLKSQKIKIPEKRSYEDSTGLLYWNKDLPVYINLSSSPEENGVRLKSKISKKYTNPFYFDTEGINYIRTKYAVDTVTKRSVNPHTEILWEVYADGKPPVSRVKLEGAKKYVLGDKEYYGKGLTIKIISKDAGAGVSDIYYSVNSGEYKKYEGKFMPDTGNDICELKYYAVDKVGNVEDVKRNTVTFFIDEYAPVTYHNVTGIDTERNIIALNTKIYLDASDSESGLKTTYYKFDEGPYIPYNGNILPLKQLTEDNHTLTYYSEDKVGNKEEPKTFDFFLDKSAPILTSDVLGDRFIVNDKIYFSGRTKLKLTAVDNKSGVKEVKYSVDGSEFKKYEAPFYLPKKPGYHIVKYYAVDRMDNNTGTGGNKYKNYKYSTKKIYVDLVGPTLKHSYIGKRFYTRDTVFLGKKSKIKLSATDNESGLQYISYSIDGEQKENMYKEPFSISGNGKHLVEYFGYDNVNNRNIGSFYVVIDENPPEPVCTFSVEPYGKEDDLNVYPSYVTVYLSGSDKMTGTEQIFYSVNGSIEKLYSAPISGFKTGKNTLRFKAVDKLGNEKYEEITFIVR